LGKQGSLRCLPLLLEPLKTIPGFGGDKGWKCDEELLSSRIGATAASCIQVCDPSRFYNFMSNSKRMQTLLRGGLGRCFRDLLDCPVRDTFLVGNGLAGCVLCGLINPADLIDGPLCLPERLLEGFQCSRVLAPSRDLDERSVAVESTARVQREAQVLEHHGLGDLFGMLVVALKRVLLQSIEGTSYASALAPDHTKALLQVIEAILPGSVPFE